MPVQAGADDTEPTVEELRRRTTELLGKAERAAQELNDYVKQVLVTAGLLEQRINAVTTAEGEGRNDGG